jgi:hypothetical protein
MPRAVGAARRSAALRALPASLSSGGDGDAGSAPSWDARCLLMSPLAAPRLARLAPGLPPQKTITGPSIPAWDTVITQTNLALKEQAPESPTEAQVAAAVQQAAQACTCPPVLEPVCGVDGVSYVSSCFAGCNGAAVQFNSSCSSARRHRAL